MRAICCAILAHLFFKLAKSKMEGGLIFMDTFDKLMAIVWVLLLFASIIAAIILCIFGM